VVADALQLALDLPLGLSASARDELTAALSRYQPPEQWTYIMVNPEMLRLLLRAINANGNSGVTLRVWTAAMTHVLWNTREIMASRATLAEDAGTTTQEVSRALMALSEMGGLVRLSPGRYAVNPRMCWRGALSAREQAVESGNPPQLRIVSKEPACIPSEP
jgi:hypothetical protein